MPVPTQQAPNIPLGQSQAVGFATRTGIQLITGSFIVEGIELFGLFDFSEAQAKWAAGLLTILLAFLQNFFEQRRNRRFIGPSPIPATLPDPDPIVDLPPAVERAYEHPEHENIAVAAGFIDEDSNHEFQAERNAPCRICGATSRARIHRV